MTTDQTGWPLTWGPGEVRALLAVRRDTYASLGEHLGANGETVRRWASGDQRPVHKALLRGLDATLAGLEPWQRAWFDQLTGSGQPAPDAGWMTGDEQESETRRDEFLQAMAALAALGPVDAVERVAQHGQRAVDAGLVAAHEDVADGLAGLHRTARADALAGLVTSHADTLFGLLDRPMLPTVRRRLEAVTVGQCAQAGLQAFRLNDRGAARRHFALARDVADDSRDGTLVAQALGVSSIVHSALPTGGQGGNTARAMRLLRAAVHHDRGLAWTCWWLACELAADGDERGFRHAATDAERLSGRAGTPTAEDSSRAGSRRGQGWRVRTPGAAWSAWAVPTRRSRRWRSRWSRRRRRRRCSR